MLSFLTDERYSRWARVRSDIQRMFITQMGELKRDVRIGCGLPEGS